MSGQNPHGENESFDPSAPFAGMPIDPAMYAGQWSSGGSYSAGNDLDAGAASLDSELFGQAPNELMNHFGWERGSHSAFQRSVDGTDINGLARGNYDNLQYTRASFGDAYVAGSPYFMPELNTGSARGSFDSGVDVAYTPQSSADPTLPTFYNEGFDQFAAAGLNGLGGYNSHHTIGAAVWKENEDLRYPQHNFDAAALQGSTSTDFPTEETWQPAGLVPGPESHPSDNDGEISETQAPPRKKAVKKTTKTSALKVEKKWKRKSKSKHETIKRVLPQLQEAADKLNKWEETRPQERVESRTSSGLFFGSVEAANAANMITFWDPPANDVTIPTTQADKETVVKDLVVAIKNNKGCLTLGTERQAFKTRWADGAIFFKESAIEAVAWRIFQLAIDVHQQGWTEPLSEPKMREDIYYSMSFSFADRMTIVKEVLMVSKPTCEHLLKGNRLQEIVGCPHTVFERIHGNSKSNTQKQKVLSDVKDRKLAETKGEPTKKRKLDADAADDTDYCPSKKVASAEVSVNPFVAVAASAPTFSAAAMASLNDGTLAGTSERTPAHVTASKRRLDQISRGYEDDDEEPTTSIAKKAKLGKRAIAPLKKAVANAPLPMNSASSGATHEADDATSIEEMPPPEVKSVRETSSSSRSRSRSTHASAHFNKPRARTVTDPASESTSPTQQHDEGLHRH
ncbi:hypothetical protein N0V94_004028 [Neodidymelliopsis sp. IMI 364377]|nr:hypothetical protein N0V94_004028 [Neodidymelliopsis sp. IMI 364377]